MNNSKQYDDERKQRIKVINIGLQPFYDEIVFQKVDALQLDWHPRRKHSAEIEKLLAQLL